MGSDILSACVFCAALLLGVELPPPSGYHFEVGISEDTDGRLYRIASGRDDVAQVTAKLGTLGVGGSWPAAAGLGAGTPQGEWQLRLAAGPSHDEQLQTPFQIGNTRGFGTGHYENFAAVLRYPLSDRDSVEVASSRRAQHATENINLGGENFVLSEVREVSATRLDLALGWRHRWKGIELGLSGRYTRPSASNSTERSSQASRGSIFGGGLDLRARRGRWSVWGSAERASGSLGVSEDSQPAFRVREFTETATVEAYRVGLGYSSRSMDIFFQGTYDRSRFPFISLAVLGTEVTPLDSGYHPTSRSRLFFWDLSLRRSIGSNLRFKALVRFSRGDETLTFTDPAGSLPARDFNVRRISLFGTGNPDSWLLSLGLATLGLGAEITLPAGSQ